LKRFEFTFCLDKKERDIKKYQEIEIRFFPSNPPLAMLFECEARASGTA